MSLQNTQRTIRVRVIRLTIGFLCLALPASAQVTIARYTITPNPNGIIAVEADLRLQNSDIYLKDHGQAENIRWSIGGKDLPFKSERKGKILFFRGLPTFGEARVSYQIKSHSQSKMEKLHGIYLIRNTLLAESGFFPGIAGLEGGLVDVRWKLPPGWKVVSGKEGIQRLTDAQEGMWAAGKPSHETEEKIGNVIFKVAVIERTILMGGPSYLDGIKSFFRYAWENYGPLDKKEYNLVIFPQKTIGGYMLDRQSLAVEDQLDISTHEMLHWWGNFQAPWWFAEGVHSYMNQKIRVQVGIGNPFMLKIYLQACLNLHYKHVKAQDRTIPLAESSENFPKEGSKSDIYPLGALFAYKLDREIQAQNQKMSLDRVFAVVYRNRSQKYDLQDLIKKETGYDPKAFFQKYLYGKVEHPEELLK